MRTIVQQDIEGIVAADLPWDALRGKTVLISGASGFLARYMVETLLALNDRWRGDRCTVLGLVRSKARAHERFAHHAGRGDLALLVQDVCEPVVTEAAKVDFVIHAASPASPKFYGPDPVGTLSANTLGTHQMLTVGRDRGAEALLYLSSSEIYGRADAGESGLTEDTFGLVDPVAQRSCYAESKRAGETMCVSWHAQFGVPAKIARPFHTYGPGMRLDDGRVFADFVADVLAGRDIVMRSDGSARRCFCYVADATIAFFTVLLTGHAGEPYNVGNPDAEVSILELAQLLTGLAADDRLRVVRQEPPPGYIRSAVLRNLPDISKIGALGWRPRTPLREGFRRTIRSFG